MQKVHLYGDESKLMLTDCVMQEYLFNISGVLSVTVGNLKKKERKENYKRRSQNQGEAILPFSTPSSIVVNYLRILGPTIF